MSGKTRVVQVVVLRKTKLGESDLILTLLASDGSQIRAVAKGARKPQSSFSARLELYCVAEVLLAEGKSLYIVKEARLVKPHAKLHGSVEHAAAAAPVAELLCHISQENLPVPRLFEMVSVGLTCLNDVDAQKAPSICAACLEKVLAFSGLRPNFTHCVICGAPITPTTSSSVLLSIDEGGVVCGACRHHVECIYIGQGVVAWSQFLLMSTFACVSDSSISQNDVFEILHLLQLLIKRHVGCSLKSLNFLFTCGLF